MGDANMSAGAGADLDAWLREGGTVVTSSDRAARALQSGFHRRRRVEGLKVWPSPQITDWNSFILNVWEDQTLDARLVLNAAQEKAIWSEIIQSDQHLLTTLAASVRRLAAMAMEAHDLLCSYAPKYLRDSARSGWDQDTGAFSHWLAEFEQYCRKNHLISPSRLPLELSSILENNSSPRPSLRLSGFDRVLPVQQTLFDAWGRWEQIQSGTQSAQISFHAARDGQSELVACAWWCSQKLQANKDARLLVVTQDLAQRRGEIERAFLRFNPPAASPIFELSLGDSLNRLPLARSALLLLRWLAGSLSENEVDWLFSNSAAASSDESAALQAAMRKIRRLDQQRIEWTLEHLIKELNRDAAATAAWSQRMSAAQLALKGMAQLQSHIEWADKISRLLEIVGWPGSESKTSTEFQVMQRWQRALDTAGSLGFMGRRISWQDFLDELENVAAETLFASESTDAPIQITGPAESSGLTADAIWFLGADEGSWPSIAPMHPFLPAHVQREAAMPHSSHAHDWNFSATITHRMIASAATLHFSFALHKDDVEARPSRLIRQIAGEALPLPESMLPPNHQPSLAAEYIDSSLVPFHAHELRGGAGILSSQSQCPFKAFANARLGAKGWDAAEAGLSAKQRGQILHDVLHSVWSGAPQGIRSHAELMAVRDLSEFIQRHVRKVLKNRTPQSVRDLMPPLYLDLEETRLVRLISEWLTFERSRFEFEVEETETDHLISISGLNMKVRLDRVDHLRDDSKLVIDYKTGTVDPKSWALPRPDDVQLPLYKIFAVTPAQQSLFESVNSPVSGGVVFAEVRTGDTCFAGRVVDARATLKPDLSANGGLVKQKLTAAQEAEWKEYIEQMATDFIHGRAEVNPRDYPKTCERCGLQSICRIQEPENHARFEDQDAIDEGGVDE
jgi:ATP-dependent helicase/nuclease subunit B